MATVSSSHQVSLGKSGNIWATLTEIGAAMGWAALPSGIIVMWAGTLATIPSGWRLCDGSSGTPDLRDKFVKGAANLANPGSTGGASTHTHSVTTNVAVADHASHTHTLATIAGTVSGSTTTNNIVQTGGGLSTASGTGNNANLRSSTTTGGPSATLTHAVTNNAVTTGSTNNEPPYYTVAYIQKI